MEIKVKCDTGRTLPLEEISVFPSSLKKHSMLEVERLVNSIENDGFLFPLAIGRVNDKNYVIDGEARYKALCELEERGCDIPDIPVFYVRCTESTIKKMILIGTSVNHAVSDVSIKKFVKGTELEDKLNDFAFSDKELIDFFDVKDMGLWEESMGGKDIQKGIKLEPGMFEELLK